MNAKEFTQQHMKPVTVLKLDLDSYGSAIRKRRYASGIRMCNLIKLMNCTDGLIYQTEQGLRKFSIKTLEKFLSLTEPKK